METPKEPNKAETKELEQTTKEVVDTILKEIKQ